MSDSKNKISFADLDGFLKVAPLIGLFVLGYLQTLFPSKVEFEKVHDKLIQNRLRLIEVDVARHNAQGSKSSRKTGS